MGTTSHAATQSAGLGAWLAEQRAGLKDELQRALRAAMFSNRFEMRPALFGRIAAEEVDALGAFCAAPDQRRASERGSALARAGLGEESVLSLAQTTRRFLFELAPEALQLPLLELAEAYHSGVITGYLAAHTALTLEEQERIRSAIQRTVNRYAVQMAVAAEVARAATSILDLDQLLQTAVELIRERFGLYYAGLFLIDEDRRWSYLQASAGEPGQVLLRRGHRLKVGGDSLVGWCIARGEARIALDVGERAISFDTPLLTDIHSEMVVPLISRGAVIGAMALQSRHVGAFSEQDVAVYRITADQLANAIVNARLYERLREELRDRVWAAEELRRAKEAAEIASRAKSTFLANMSHELRTPLTGIIGYSELLEREATHYGYASFVPDLRKIRTAGSHLLALINDILDLSKIEAGKAQLYLESFALGALLDEVATTAAPLIDQNANRFELIVPEDPGTLYSDLTKLRQIILNLLSNAAKFTEAGRVELRVAREGREEGEWLRISISDTGIGISQEQLALLFQEFTQADASMTRRYGGTGLGLALTRRLCQLLGGTIEVASTPGVGSTFTVSIPAMASGEAEQAAPEQ